MKPSASRLIAVIAAVLLSGYLLVAGIADEIPVGSVTGQVTMEENGRPLADAFITLRALGAPEEDQRQAFYARTDSTGHFRYRQLPAGEYRLSTSTEAHSVADQRVSVPEGKTLPLAIKATPNAPYLNLYASQKVFTPNESPTLDVSAFNPGHPFRLDVFRVDLDKVVKEKGYQAAVRPFISDGSSSPSPDAKDLVLSQVTKPTDLDAEGRYVKSVRLGPLAEGTYLVRGGDGKNRANAIIFVSRIGMITKSTAENTLCYVTDLVTGNPVAGVTISTARANALTAVATTDHNGLATVSKPSDPDQHQVLLARRSPSVALVDTSSPNPDDRATFITAYCERPAYRPGDTVNFKGFVRRRDVSGYALPGAGTVKVTIKDPDDNELTKLTLPLSDHGSYHGSFTTSSEAKPGGYIIETEAFGAKSSDAYANVVAYRKPEFAIEVKPTRDHFTLGDRASATVDCKYYYGGPVVGAKVSVIVYRAPAYRFAGEDEDQPAGIYSGGGEYSQQVEAITDASGRATVEFPTRADDDPAIVTNDFIYTIEANVSETDGRAFNGSGEIRVVRGDYDLTLDVQNALVCVGQSVRLKVKTTDPVNADVPSPNRPVSIEIGTERWDGNEPKFRATSRINATTDPAGVAELTIPVTGKESIAIRATSVDPAGRTIVAEAYAYVAGAATETTPEPGNLKITMDHRSYEAGQTAKALIQTDMPGGSALVCIQTDKILWHQVVPLTSAATLVELPVMLDYAPNVYVTAAYIHEKQFYEASKRIKVNREDRKLTIDVSSNAAAYLPGAKVRLHVRTTVQGKETPAEVSLAVVDQGVYAISPDSTDLYAALYPERYDQVITAYSFPEVYLDGGDKGTSKVPFRKNFRDTAAWIPAVWTGKSGEAHVEVTLPDNLTGWRVTAVGLTDRSDAGMNTTSFQARKPLMVRLGLPQFLVEGDEMRLTAVVSNDESPTANVNLHLSAEGVKLSGTADYVLAVAKGAPQTQTFDITTGKFGEATIGAQAASRQISATDGVQQKVKVLPYGRLVTESRAGEGPAHLTLANPANQNQNFGELTIQLEPSLAGNLVSSLDGLIDYPYGCVEQTMSRFLPSILVERAVKKLGIAPPEKLKELPKIVRDSLTRLDQMRHSDGGWGWWENDASEPFMTALVLDGLARARDAGYDVHVANPKAGADWAMKYLASKPQITDRDRVYLIYASLRWGKKDAAKWLDGVDFRDRTITVNLRPTRRPQTAELALAALAFQVAGRPERAASLTDQLLRRANRGSEIASWADEDDAWGQEPTALALVALESIRPAEPIIPQVVRYLLRQRQGNQWSSTRDTAYSLIGLSAYLESTRELTTRSEATVTVNGKTVAKVPLDPTLLADPKRTIILPRQKLPAGPLRVGISTTGAGKSYYSVQLRGLETDTELAPKTTDDGLSVRRDYYRMEVRRMENGEQKLVPSQKPVTSFKSGDLVRVVISIQSDRPREFVMVDEPTPSACRVTERDDLADGEEWSWWWSRTVIMDDHLAFFARHLPKGNSKITYNMRAEQIGRVRALPTSVRNMYDPGRWASGAASQIEVGQ